MFMLSRIPLLRRKQDIAKKNPLRSSPRPSSVLRVEELERRLTPTSTTIPFYIANKTQEFDPNSGLANNQIYVYFEAQTVDQGPQVPFNINTTTGAVTTSSGGFTPTLLSSLPTETLKYGTFSKLTIDTSSYPNLYGGRLYFANSSTALSASGGVVQSFPATKSNFYYDYVEFAVTASNSSLTVDTTQVDQVGMPITLQVNPQDPLNPTGSGTIATLDRQTMFSNYNAAMTANPQFDGYQDCLISNGSGGYYQILSPQNLIDSQLTTNSNGTGNGIQMIANIAVGTGTPGNWTTTVSLIGNNNLQFTNGMQVEGPFVPAGSTVSGIPNPNPGPGGDTFTLTSTLPVNPFLGATNVPLLVYNAPATKLNSYFGPAVGQTANLNSGNSIDEFFDYWKSNPNKLLVENTSNSNTYVYTGNVTTITAPNINGTYLPATLSSSGSAGSWSATLSIGTGLGVGNSVSGPGLPANSFIASIPSSLTMTVTSNAADNPFTNQSTAQNYVFNGLTLPATLAVTGSANNWVATLTIPTASAPNTTAGLNVGDAIVGPGIPAGSIISAIPNSLTVSIANNSTGGNPFANQPVAQNYGFFTGSNFPATLTTSGSAGSWTATLTLNGGTNPTAGLHVGDAVYGQGIPAKSTIASIVNNTTITISSIATTNPFVAQPTAKNYGFYPADTMTATLASSGAAGAWIATLTLSGTGNTTAGLVVGDPISGPGIPAGSVIASITGNTTLTIANSATDNPFTNQQTATGYIFYPSNNLSTYTVLQFTNSTTSEVYNIYYPYFATNSPAGKTDPFGNTVPQPPQWWALQAPRLSPSEMVFASNTVFADNGKQFANSYNGNQSTLGSLENIIGTALARGVGTTWQFGNGATFNPGTSQQASWTLPKAAYDAIKDNISVGMNVTSWKIFSVPMTISAITVDPTSGNATITVTTTSSFGSTGAITDLLTFFSPYQTGQKWSAYSAFMHNLIPNPNASPGGPATYQNFIGGRAYALPYDDNGGFSSTITSINPVAPDGGLTITLSPWTPNGEMGEGTGSEVAVGSGQGSLPEVKIYDQNGAIVSRFLAYDAGFLGGVEVASGDLTRDGFPEIITGAGPGGGPHVKIFDGKTGLLIRGFFAFDPGFTGGVSVATGDVNNDGFGDIIVGAGVGGGPRVCVFDGKTGAMIRSFYAYDSKFTGGVRVASGDTNDDFYSDIITGAGMGGGPNVKVFSGLDNTLLRSFFAYDSDLRNGVYVSAGDLDRDFVSEIFTGTGYGSGPQVKVFNPKTLEVVHDFYAYDQGFTGGVRVAAEDLNLDGQLDIITGVGKSGGPNVKAFDGKTLAILDSFFAFPETFTGGIFVG